MKPTIGYKFIKEDMFSKNGNLKWTLGKWETCKEDIKLCKIGLHACIKPLDSLEYIYGDRWFIVEARSKIEKGDNKFVASEMRLIKEIDVKAVSLRFACIAARSCLKNYEDKYPKDKRLREAIEAAEEYIKHPTEENRLKAVKARSAAWSAAWSAELAARSAARSAAGSAESAARSAAWSAESAAGSAESAAWSARSAAGSAARSAAWSAAWSARSAAREHLNSELEKLIKKHIIKK